jgi:hypothetical protein
MAISGFNSYPDNSTDTNFRAWGGGLSGALTAVGLAKTADTGQINWSTVTHPSTVGVWSGYEIRQFSDSIGNNIVFKVEFGSGSGTATYPNTRWTFGNGSDGAGNITGNTKMITLSMSSGTSTTQYPCWASSNGAYLTLCLWNGYNGPPLVLSVGRTKDNSGNDTTDGINIVYITYAAASSTFLPANGGGSPVTNSWLHTAAPMGTGTGSYGTSLGVFPVYVSRGRADNPDMGAIVVFNNDFNGQYGSGAIFVEPFYGTNHTYQYCWMGNQWQPNGNTQYASLALRYE